jgi:hypothetical protein
LFEKENATVNALRWKYRSFSAEEWNAFAKILRRKSLQYRLTYLETEVNWLGTVLANDEL